MSLTRRERNEVVKALLNAFPTPDDLATFLLRELDRNLSQIEANNSRLPLYDYVVMLADGEAWLAEMLRKAKDKYRDNPHIAAVYRTVIEYVDSPGEGEASLDRVASGDEAFRVFLADTPDELDAIRRQLESKLPEAGIEVLGPIPPPHEENKHRAAVERASRRAHLCVHLLGVAPGAPIADEDPRTFGTEQLRLGFEHARSQLLLYPEGFKVEQVREPGYRSLIEKMNDSIRDPDRLERVCTSKHRMLDEILKKKDKLVASTRRKLTQESRVESAFIDLHPRDFARAEPLVNFLTGRNITPVLVPQRDDDPTSMKNFDEIVRKARLLIVFFGEVARARVASRLSHAVQTAINFRLDTAIGVYVGPPKKPDEELQFPKIFHVAVNVDRFDPRTMDALLAGAESSIP